MASIDELRVAALALTEVLRNNGVKHAYIGGFATNILGGIRSTEDIDVVVQLPPNVFNESIMPKLLQDQRFNSTREMGGLYFIHPQRHIKIDIISGGTMETPSPLGTVREGTSIPLIDVLFTKNFCPFLEQGVPLLPATEILKLKLNRLCLLLVTPKYLQGVTVYKDKVQADLKDITHLIEVMEGEGSELIVDEKLRERLKILETELAKRSSFQSFVSKLKNLYQKTNSE